jgi:hypothetical protein
MFFTGLVNGVKNAVLLFIASVAAVLFVIAAYAAIFISIIAEFLQKKLKED